MILIRGRQLLLFSQASFSFFQRKKQKQQGALIQNGRFPSCHADVNAGSKLIGCLGTGHAPFTHGAAIKRLNHSRPWAVSTKATIGSIQELTKHPERWKKGAPVAAGGGGGEASEFSSQPAPCADHWGSIADAIPSQAHVWKKLPVHDQEGRGECHRKNKQGKAN